MHRIDGIWSLSFWPRQLSNKLLYKATKFSSDIDAILVGDLEDFLPYWGDWSENPDIDPDWLFLMLGFCADDSSSSSSISFTIIL